jgi:DNA invertase Pin-like site-specific DNA recombinase
MKLSVACTRVSTAEQDRSGLELDAQREAIQDTSPAAKVSKF